MDTMDTKQNRRPSLYRRRTTTQRSCPCPVKEL